MDGNIISLIQENRKLFYKGLIRNQYKSNSNVNEYQEVLPKPNDPNNIKEKSLRLLQEFFN